MIVLQHILLALAVGALAGAGIRIATLLGSRGLERLVVAAVCAGAFAVLSGLLLSTVALGSSPILLSLLAFGAWLATRQLVPDLGVRPSAELTGWWSEAPAGVRYLVVGCAGAWAAWALWLARWPILGTDSMIYHVPEVIEWIHNGTPGSVSPIFVGYPIGAYPITDEVMMTWPASIARSWVPILVWAPSMLVLLSTAAWVGLRELRIPRIPATLAIAVICLTPPLTHWQKNGAHTDLPALTWLVCTATLFAVSIRRPMALVPMVVAAALAIGTKTTIAPLLLVVLISAFVVHRHRLRELAGPLTIALGVGVFVGGFWYLRNFVLHGSPLWPFIATPWGDPVPKIIDPAGHVVGDVYNSWTDAPKRTTEYIFRDWARPFLGGITMLGAALAAPLFVRRRPVVLGALVTLGALLIWMNAPFTGVWQQDISQSAPLTTMRYLVPCWTVAALTLALASRETRVGRIYATSALSVVLAITLWQLFDLGFPSVPSPRIVIAGAVAAMAAVAVATRLIPRGLDWPALMRRAAVPGLVAAGALAALAANNFVDRYVHTVRSQADAGFTAVPQLLEWLERSPDYKDGNEPIAFNAAINAAAAGNRLQHPVNHISPKERCPATVRRLDGGLIVYNRAWALPEPCLDGHRPIWAEGEFRVYTDPGTIRSARRAADAEN